MSDTIVSVKEEDFLTEDPPLRGQNYVCLSFVSPEDVIKKKEVYFFEHFLKSFSSDLGQLFENLTQKYPDDIDKFKMIQDRYSYLFGRDSLQEEYNFFVNTQGNDLDKQYYEENNFQTSIRGIKVRGVFDTMREAQIRSQVLSKLDDRFNVYVAQVGCWCPWSPNPDDIGNQEYAETHLNSLMKKYKENQSKKDVFFEERKKEMQFLKTKEKLEETDPWMSRKKGEDSTEDKVESGTEASTSKSTDDNETD